MQLEDTAHEIFSADTFLPDLKRFESDICLGIASPLFEEKVSLTHLSLDCTHISTKGSGSDWNGIIKFWKKNLKCLGIK